MRVLSLSWVGTRTAEYAASVAFFTDVLGLRVHSLATDFAVLEVPDGATVELFGPDSAYNRHLTHPVAGSSWRISTRRRQSCEARGRRSCWTRRAARCDRGCTSAHLTGSCMSSPRIARRNLGTSLR